MSNIIIAICGIVGGLLVGCIVGSKWVGKQYDLHCERLEKNADKWSDYYNLLLQWVKVHHKGKRLNDYFVSKGYKHIALYGMNDLAYVLIAELKDTDTKIDFCIDRNADNLFIEMKCYRPDEEIPEVDMCVIALPELFERIADTLQPKLKCPIVSIEDVIWEI